MYKKQVKIKGALRSFAVSYKASPEKLHGNQIKDHLYDLAKIARKTAIESGFFVGDKPFLSRKKVRETVRAAIQDIKEGILAPPLKNWKISSGVYIEVTLEQLELHKKLATHHIESMYAIERNLSILIEHVDLKDIDSLNALVLKINAAWPQSVDNLDVSI